MIKEQTITVPGFNTVTVDFGMVPGVKSIKFQQTIGEWLSLNEVRAFGAGSDGMQLLPAASASSKSSWNGPPDKAIDGNTDGRAAGGSIARTEQPPESEISKASTRKVPYPFLYW